MEVHTAPGVGHNPRKVGRKEKVEDPETTFFSVMEKNSCWTGTLRSNSKRFSLHKEKGNGGGEAQCDKGKGSKKKKSDKEGNVDQNGPKRYAAWVKGAIHGKTRGTTTGEKKEGFARGP